jgi:hypothetical protein
MVVRSAAQILTSKVNLMMGNLIHSMELKWVGKSLKVSAELDNPESMEEKAHLVVWHNPKGSTHSKV